MKMAINLNIAVDSVNCKIYMIGPRISINWLLVGKSINIDYSTFHLIEIIISDPNQLILVIPHSSYLKLTISNPN